MDPRKLFRNHYAFLVGIDEYKYFPRLQGAHSDAKTLYKALRWVGYPKENLHLVPQGTTSRDDLKREIRAFLTLVGKADQNPDIVIFWAGHGVYDEGLSFVVSQDTTMDNWAGTALSLEWLTSQFTPVSKASFTMFFDACHSVPPHRDKLNPWPQDLILDDMCREVRTTFVGVSTLASEIWVWDKVHRGQGRVAGILADAVQRAVHGEPCDRDDKEWCYDDPDFAVTNDRLVNKLAGAVRRKADAEDVYQQLSVVTYRLGTKRKIGLAVRSFSHAKLNELQLPAEADLLARLVVDRSGPFLDHMTGFGVKMAELTRELIDESVTKDDFEREERKLTYSAILDLPTDSNLDSHAYFLLRCREEAKRDDGAKKVLQKIYDYLVSGGSWEELRGWLDGQYRGFAIRLALPWSCGIRVLHGKDEHGYAPIIYQGAPIIIGHDTQRIFVTTAPLQQKARLEVWRADTTTSTIRNLNTCYYAEIHEFPVELPIGSRVWVGIGLDTQGCVESCYDDTSVYVPMKTLLGREGHRDRDCYRHWHLKLGEGWNGLRGAGGTGPEPPRMVGLRRLMDECRRSLEALLASSPGSHEQGDDHAAVLIRWLYLADVVVRMWDESRLGYVVQELIIGLRGQRIRSVARLASALRNVMEPGAEEDSPDDQEGSGTYLEGGPAILDAHRQWRTEQPGAPADAVRRADLLAWLLRAVTTEGSAKRTAVEQFVELVATMSPEEESETLGEVVAVVAPSVALRARGMVARLADAVVVLLQEEGANLLPAQREILRTWWQFANEALERDQAREALDGFFAQMKGSIGIAAWLLAREYLNVTAPIELRVRFNMLATRLQASGDQLETREAAEQMYRLLEQLHDGQLRRDEAVPEEGIDVLLVLNALLWPQSAGDVVQLLAGDVDRRTAFRIASAFAGSQGPKRVEMIGDADVRKMIRMAATMDWVLRGPVPADPEPTGPAQHRAREERGWHDQMLLAVPPGERLGALSSPEGDGT